VSDSCCGQVETATSLKKASEIAKNHADRHAIDHDNTTTVVTVFDVMARRDCQDTWEFPIANAYNCPQCIADKLISEGNVPGVEDSCVEEPDQLTGKPLPAIVETMLARMSPVQLEYRRFDGLASAVDELIRHDESRTDEKLRQMIATADAEADRDDGREPGDTRDEESLEDHNIQGLGAYRDVFDAGGEQ